MGTCTFPQTRTVFFFAIKHSSATNLWLTMSAITFPTYFVLGLADGGWVIQQSIFSFSIFHRQLLTSTCTFPYITAFSCMHFYFWCALLFFVSTLISCMHYYFFVCTLIFCALISYVQSYFLHALLFLCSLI